MSGKTKTAARVVRVFAAFPVTENPANRIAAAGSGKEKAPPRGNGNSSQKKREVKVPPRAPAPYMGDETEEREESVPLSGIPTKQADIDLESRAGVLPLDGSKIDSILNPVAETQVATPVLEIPLLPPVFTPKQRASDKIIAQNDTFNLAVRDLMVGRKYSVLRYEDHKIAIVTPEMLLSGNPLVFHVQYADAYERRFKVGDIVKGEFGNGVLRTSAMCAIVNTKEEAEEMAKRFKRLGQIVVSESKRYAARPDVADKFSRNQVHHQQIASVGKAAVPPAPAPSVVVEKARTKSGNPTETRDLTLAYEEFMRISSPFGHGKVSDAVLAKEVPKSSSGTISDGAAASSSRTDTSKKRPSKTSTGTENAKKSRKSENKVTGSVIVGKDEETDVPESLGFSQSTGPSSQDDDYVHPYGIKGDNKVRLSSQHKVYMNKLVLTSAIERCKSRSQLAQNMAVSLLGGKSGISFFYRTKMPNQGVSKVHKEMVEAISEFVHSQKKIGGVTGHPPLQRIGQMLGSYLASYYRRICGDPTVESE